MGVLVAELESRSALPSRDVVLVGAYAFGVPVVHGYHRQWLHLAASMAMRVVLPALGGYSNSIKNQEVDSRGLAWGMLGGMAIASVVDAALSWD